MSSTPWDPNPWMIGGGVAHSEGAVRLGNYVTMGGDEGVVGGNDLAVTPTSPPSGAVQIAPGACAINNQQGYFEAYAGRLLGYDTIPIASTGGASRTDMIIARVEDPFQSGTGWPVPAPGTENAQQYIRTAVISGVSGNPLPRSPSQAGYGYSAIPLALVTLPAGTSTVQAEHITDLRNITKIRQVVDMTAVKANSSGANIFLTSTEYVTWLTTAAVNLWVPIWATEVNVRYLLSGIGYGVDNGPKANVYGKLKAVFGADAAMETIDSRYNVSVEGGVDRTLVMCAGKILLPEESGYRGTFQTLQLKGLKLGGNTSLFADDDSTITADWSFRQNPETT